MELEEDRDSAQDPLGENGERKRHRAPEEPAWQARDAEGRRGGHERRQADGEARDAVPELDEGVVVLRRQERLAAARPVLAAEARTGEAHRRARNDDEEESGERRPGEPREDRGRGGEGAEPGAAGPGLHHERETATPLPSTTRPMRARKRRWAAKCAVSTGLFSPGSVKSRPPDVCGSKPRAARSSGVSPSSTA